MEKITVATKPCEIESLKKYSRYLCYQAAFEKPVVEYSLEELQSFIPAWNAKAQAAGLQRVAELAEKQEVLFDVYPREESDPEAGGAQGLSADPDTRGGEEDPQKQDVKLWYLPAIGVEGILADSLDVSKPTGSPDVPSGAVEAKKPFIILNAGGTYCSVCTMVEAFPTAVHFNKMGYHVFCLNYRVGGREVFPKPMDDLAAAYKYIIAHKEQFGLQSEEYIVGGFSAGGSLTTIWGTESRGYKHYGVKKPLALFTIYPVVSRDRFYLTGSDMFLETMFGDKASSVEYMICRAKPPVFYLHMPC